MLTACLSFQQHKNRAAMDMPLFAAHHGTGADYSASVHTVSFCSAQVCLSSSAHKRSSVLLDDLDFSKSGYDPWKSYGQSKTANIWMATEIERRYGSKGEHPD